MSYGEGKCGCGRPLKHLGRCAFRRRKKGKMWEEIKRRNSEFADSQGVSLDNEHLVVIASPVTRMTPRAALIHASHLIAVADPDPASQEFLEVFGRVIALAQAVAAQQRR